MYNTLKGVTFVNTNFKYSFDTYLKIKMKKITFTRRKNRKGLSEMAGVGLAFVLIAVILGVGGMILSQMSNKINDTNSTAIMNQGTSAISDLSSWLPIIAVVVASVVIIGLILRGFSGVGSKNGGGI